MTGGSWRAQTALTLAGENLLPFATQAIAISLQPNVTQTMLYGTGSGTISGLIARSYPLAPGTSVTLNLFDGSLTDVAGGTVNWRLLRGYSVWISANGDSGGVTVGNADTNAHPLFFGATTHTKTVYPSGGADGGGSPDGITIDSSACNVKIVNNGAVAATVSVNIAGTNAVGGAPMGLFPMLTYP